MHFYKLCTAWLWSKHRTNQTEFKSSAPICPREKVQHAHFQLNMNAVFADTIKDQWHMHGVIVVI